MLTAERTSGASDDEDDSGLILPNIPRRKVIVKLCLLWFRVYDRHALEQDIFDHLRGYRLGVAGTFARGVSLT